jgi:hypothetical protein
MCVSLSQNFQRIQRNRQSRIRVKLCRRAGKRQDEVLLEEDSPTPPAITSPASSNHGGGGGSGSGPSANHSEDIVDIDGEDSLAPKAVRLEASPSASAVDPRAAGKGTFSRDRLCAFYIIGTDFLAHSATKLFLNWQ